MFNPSKASPFQPQQPLSCAHTHTYTPTPQSANNPRPTATHAAITHTQKSPGVINALKRAVNRCTERTHTHTMTMQTALQHAYSNRYLPGVAPALKKATASELLAGGKGYTRSTLKYPYFCSPNAWLYTICAATMAFVPLESWSCVHACACVCRRDKGAIFVQVAEVRIELLHYAESFNLCAFVSPGRGTLLGARADVYSVMSFHFFMYSANSCSLVELLLCG